MQIDSGYKLVQISDEGWAGELLKKIESPQEQSARSSPAYWSGTLDNMRQVYIHWKQTNERPGGT